LGPRLSSLTVALAAALVCSCSGTTAAPNPPPLPAGCRTGPPEAGVHNPDRLKVLNPCRRATGVVVDVAHEDDGDYHVWFTVDPGYEDLINKNVENHFQARPAMLAEITPDCPLSTHPPDAKSAAQCPRSDLPIPAIGNHIQIYGPWVFDADHGWNEIHPVDSIQIR
jgi:hypothetical protein